MYGKTFATALVVGGALMCASISAAFAQGEGIGPKETYIGRFVSNTPSCPSLDFHVVAMKDGTLHGFAFDPMMSGQMSTVAGDIGADGKVHLTMAAMNGKGATGTADGAVQNGNLALTMTNAACPMPKVTLMAVQKAMFYDGHG
jgi:hypothetical protein